MLFPFTTARSCRLDSAGAADAPQIHALHLEAGEPALPMLDNFWPGYVGGAAACFLVRSNDSGDAPGPAGAHSRDGAAVGPLLGAIRIATLKPAGHLDIDRVFAADCPDEVRTAALGLSIQFAFAMWRTTKVYLNSVAADPASLGLGELHHKLVVREAVLPEYQFREGRLRDQYFYSVRREAWDATGVDLVRQLVKNDRES